MAKHRFHLGPDEAKFGDAERDAFPSPRFASADSVTPAMAAEGDACHELLERLDAALATALVAVLRYRQHHFMSRDEEACAIAGEFLVYSMQEQGHADRLAERIEQLGGTPDFSPHTLAARSHAGFAESVSLAQAIRDNRVAEQATIACYREAIAQLGGSDPRTSRMLEKILAVMIARADALERLSARQAADAIER